jgi:hypothetical protein
MPPVSTILLQENSFKPAQQAGFFFAAVLLTNLIHKRSGSMTRTLEECHGQVTFRPYTGFTGYTQPICVIAEGVLLAAHRTDFCVSWPDLGLCPSSVGGHFFLFRILIDVSATHRTIVRCCA